jgi:GT2 family glycosyltransferase
MAYLHPGWVPHEFVESQLDVLRSRDDVIRVAAQSGPGIARNRNLVAGWFINSDADWLLWVDSDMVFTADDVKALLATEEPLIAAHALRVNTTDHSTAPAAVKRLEDGTFEPVKVDDQEWYPHEFIPVAGVGMAFTLIHRDVYEAVGVAQGHPHRERFTEDGVLVGEDVGFCLFAKEKGYQPKLAPGVRVGHVKAAIYR